MIASCAGMNRINNELGRTQNELGLPFLENFALFASFAVHDLFHRKERKGRKDGLIGLYVINHRAHREHREKWQNISMPAMVNEKAAASLFRKRMTQIARIFTDILDKFVSPFHSTDIKQQGSHRAQSKITNLCALRVLCGDFSLFISWFTRIYMYPCASVSSVQSVFYFTTSAFIRVHPRLIFVPFSDRAEKIRGEF